MSFNVLSEIPDVSQRLKPIQADIKPHITQKAYNKFGINRNLCDKHIYLFKNLKFKKNQIERWREYFAYIGDITNRQALRISSYSRGSCSYLRWFRRRLFLSWDRFQELNFLLTLTHNSKWNDCVGCAWKNMPKRWKSYRRYLQQSLGIANQYFVCLEPHKSYFPHYHIPISGRWVNKKVLADIREIWGARVKYQKLLKPAGYVLKYLTKMSDNLKFHGLLSSLNLRQYYTSKGLLCSLKYAKKMFNHAEFIYFDTKPFIPFQESHIELMGESKPDYLNVMDGWSNIAQTNEFRMWVKSMYEEVSNVV